MKRPKNEAIGECPCPVAGCTVLASVHKFRARENELQRRLAGKLYLCCRVHGRLGADGAAEMQEIILRGATIWDQRSEKAGPAPAHDQPGAGAPAVSDARASAPTSPAAEPSPKKSDPWDIWNLGKL